MSEEIKVLSVEEALEKQAPEAIVVAVMVESFDVDQGIVDKASARLVSRIRDVMDKVSVVVLSVIKPETPEVPEGHASVSPLCAFQTPQDSSKLLSSDMALLVDGDRVSVLRGSELELGSVVA